MRYFPPGIAKGDAFCNRVHERKKLRQYIDSGSHTVLMAPRRYGKSSLITQTMIDGEYIYVWVDFLSVASEEDVIVKIRDASKSLFMRLSPEFKKLKMQTADKFKALSPELNLNAVGQSLTLHLATESSMPIDDVLKGLDEYAGKIKKKAVLVFDEFQQISQIQSSHKVEALIRHAVERSAHITYIFSGSNRHMLGEMFSKQSRPLYRLCSLMQLDRISGDDYKKFISNAAIKHWETEIEQESIVQILSVTERHPFYVNALCNELWFEKVPPSEAQVKLLWKSYVLNHKSVIVSDVIPLSINQKKVLRFLSLESESEPTGQAFSQKIKMNPASVRQALNVLILKDLVYENNEGEYIVLDPAISYYFRYIH